MRKLITFRGDPYSTITLWFFLIILSSHVFVNGIHQKLNDFFRESSFCYDVPQERNSYASKTYSIGLRYQNYTHSVDTFINLVEKIEEGQLARGRRTPAELLVKTLLRKFHISGLKKNLPKFSQYPEGLFRSRLADVLLDNGRSVFNSRNDFISELLTLEEQCTLHYLLTHFIMPLNKVQLFEDYFRSVNLGRTSEQKNKGPISTLNNYGISPQAFKHIIDSPELSKQKLSIYEQGVARLTSSDTEAIEFNRVLLGILAGLSQTKPLSTYNVFEQLFRILNPQGNSNGAPFNVSELRDLKDQFDPLLAVTLGDLWALYPVSAPESFSLNAGNKLISSWNNAFCPVYYQTQFPNTREQDGQVQLDKSYKFCSPSQLRGGLDGLVIGYGLSRVGNIRNKLRLSQILKLYYSGKGFAPLARDANVCRRNDVLDVHMPRLHIIAKRYLQLALLTLSETMISEEEAESTIKENSLQFTSKLNDVASPSEELRQYCSERGISASSSNFYPRAGPSSYGNTRDSYGDDLNSNSYGGVSDPYSDTSYPGMNQRPRMNGYGSINSESSLFTCETAVDLVFVLDMSNYVSQQLQTISRLLASRSMHQKESVTLLANRPGTGFYKDALHVISWRSRIKERPICDLQQTIEAEKSIYTISRADELFNRLNVIFNHMRAEQNESFVTPGKSLIIFNFGFLKHDQSQEFLAARHLFAYNHRAVKSIVIGQGDREDLRSLVVNAREEDEAVFADIAESSNLGFAINKVICETHSIIQYSRCNEIDSRFGDSLNYLYVTPNSIQYFVIPSDQYFSSQYLKLRFSVQSQHNIRVCMSNNNHKPEEVEKKSRYCYDLNNQQDRVIEFNLGHACEAEYHENCPNIYLSLIGLNMQGQDVNCIEDDCIGIDQIRVDFSHEGMQCNSVFKFLISPIVILVAISLYFWQQKYLTI